MAPDITYDRFNGDYKSHSDAMQEQKLKLRGLSGLIGNTPMLRIRFNYQGEARTLYSKAESYNLSGSIKDRMALCILRTAYEQGHIQPGDTIAEATSGNAGIALATLGRALGHPVVIFMPDWMSQERVLLMESLGARVVKVSSEEGGFVGSIRKAEEFAKNNPNVFLPRQFENTANVCAHRDSTGVEILDQLASIGKKPEAFVCGVGTGGSVMGVAQKWKEAAPNAKVFPMEPSESPTLSTGYKVGKHRIQGISDEFIPKIFDQSILCKPVCVNDGDAILMAQKLSRQLGLGVGISSGANFVASLKVQNALGKDSVVSTVFADDCKKYLSTDLFKSEPLMEKYLSTDVELVSYDVIPKFNAEIRRSCSDSSHPTPFSSSVAMAPC